MSKIMLILRYGLEGATFVMAILEMVADRKVTVAERDKILALVEGIFRNHGVTDIEW